MQKKRAASLVEVLIILIVLGFLMVIVIPYARNTSNKNLQQLAVIKANSTIKEIINSMLNDSKYYSSNHNFANINSVDGQPENEKFKTAFNSFLSNTKEVNCPMYTERQIKLSFCTLGQDNIAWGIPWTNFTEKDASIVNLMQNNVTIQYLPITVYINYKEKQALPNANSTNKATMENYFYNNAIMYGIRRDGQIIFLDNIIDESAYPKALHYQAKKIIASKQ